MNIVKNQIRRQHDRRCGKVIEAIQILNLIVLDLHVTSVSTSSPKKVQAGPYTIHNKICVKNCCCNCSEQKIVIAIIGNNCYKDFELFRLSDPR